MIENRRDGEKRDRHHHRFIYLLNVLIEGFRVEMRFGFDEMVKRWAKPYFAVASIFLTIGWQIIYRFPTALTLNHPHFWHFCCCNYLRKTSDGYSICSCCCFFLRVLFLLACYIDQSCSLKWKKKQQLGKIHTLEARITHTHTHTVLWCAYTLDAMRHIINLYILAYVSNSFWLMEMYTNIKYFMVTRFRSTKRAQELCCKSVVATIVACLRCNAVYPLHEFLVGSFARPCSPSFSVSLTLALALSQTHTLLQSVSFCWCGIYVHAQ